MCGTERGTDKRLFDRSACHVPQRLGILLSYHLFKLPHTHWQICHGAIVLLAPSGTVTGTAWPRRSRLGPAISLRVMGHPYSGRLLYQTAGWENC